MMHFKSPLEWPAEAPKADDYAGRVTLYHMTHGRCVCDFEYIEKRARRLLYYWGSPPGQLGGSQYKGSPESPYYTELFAHEMGHVLHVPYPLKELRVEGVEALIERFTKTHSTEENNLNELQASAATTLVLEMLGMPYDLFGLLTSTARNLGGRLYVVRDIYPEVLEQRRTTLTQQVARQIACMLAKMKNG